jgi:hypothetical protein
MKISVSDDTGECFSYDTAKDSMCLHPNKAETPAVLNALLEATNFLVSPKVPAPAHDGA